MNIQIHIFTAKEQVNSVCDLLTLCGALAITLQDAAQEDLYEIDLGKINLWAMTRITALFDTKIDVLQIQTLVTEAVPTDTPLQFVVEELVDKVWEREWLKDFKPMRFGNRLWICPHGQLPSDQGVVVYLDPGLAFGTGTHPTTGLCLEWLDGFELGDKVLVDYGCGSGILSLAALKLGANSVWAVDHDPQALVATKENAKQNRIHTRQIHVVFPEELPNDLKTDIVLANILAQPLIDLMPVLTQLIHPNGRLVLSGILEEQLSSVLKAYKQNFEIINTKIREGWALVELVKFK